MTVLAGDVYSYVSLIFVKLSYELLMVADKSVETIETP